MRLFLLLGLVLICVFVVFWFFRPPKSLAGEGRYVFVTSTVSPNGEYTADSYIFGGGATVSTFSFVLVRLSSEKSNPNDFDRRVFLMERKRNFELKWVNNLSLSVGHEEGEIFLKKSSINGVTLTYQTIKLR